MRSVSPSPPTLSAYQTVNWLSVDSSWDIHYCIHFTDWTLINTFGASVPDYSYSSQDCFQTLTKTSWQCVVGGGWCPQLPRAVLAQMTRGAATHLLLLAVTDQNVNIRRGGEQRTQLVPQNGCFCDSDNLTSLCCVGSQCTQRESNPRLQSLIELYIDQMVFNGDWGS